MMSEKFILMYHRQRSMRLGYDAEDHEEVLMTGTKKECEQKIKEELKEVNPQFRKMQSKNYYLRLYRNKKELDDLIEAKEGRIW